MGSIILISSASVRAGRCAVIEMAAMHKTAIAAMAVAILFSLPDTLPRQSCVALCTREILCSSATRAPIFLMTLHDIVKEAGP